MGFKMQRNDHYKMGLYFVLELLCTFYWDGSEDPREWGFSSQPKPRLWQWGVHELLSPIFLGWC